MARPHVAEKRGYEYPLVTRCAECQELLAFDSATATTDQGQPDGIVVVGLLGDTSDGSEHHRYHVEQSRSYPRGEGPREYYQRNQYALRALGYEVPTRAQIGICPTTGQPTHYLGVVPIVEDA